MGETMTNPAPALKQRASDCLLLTASLLLVACPQSTLPETTSYETERSALEARILEGAVVETIHGVEVSDPYRALETDDALTRAFIDLETARTDTALVADPALREALDRNLSIGVLASPRLAGERLFYERRDGRAEQAALVVREGAVDRVLLDPSTLGERVALDYWEPSPRGRFVVVGISENGDERSTLRVLDVATATFMSDTIARAKWSHIEIMGDETGFYYTRYPAPGEAGYDEAEPEAYFSRLFHHRLGADPSSDPLVFAAEGGTDTPSPRLSDDDRYLLVHVSRGWSANDLYVLDRGASQADRVFAPDASHVVRPIFVGGEEKRYGDVAGGTLFLQTNRDAPKYRIVSMPIATVTASTPFVDVIPEGEATLDGFLVTRDRIVVQRAANLRAELDVYDHRGAHVGAIALPTHGNVGGLAADEVSGALAFTFDSYLYPPTLMRVAQDALTPVVVDQVRVPVSLEGLSFRIEYATSRDGTRVPIQIVSRGDLPPSPRVLLYGYGGFDVSLMPGFQRNLLHFVQSGGVYAVANLRGGGEFGEAWHRAGMREGKPRVFEDFEAAIQHFHGVTCPGRIGIMGGSNGGLLVSAVATRSPSIFGAGIASVGLHDMVRFHRFPPAELWTREYGDPDAAEDFPFLLAYSPYHAVREGTAYPAMLIDTADHDTRVHWAHSTKLAARLQRATRGPAPIYFHMERAAGHGSGATRTQLVERYTRTYTFLDHALAAACD